MWAYKDTTDFYLLKHTPIAYIYTTAYMPSTVQRNAITHQLPHFSTILFFFCLTEIENITFNVIFTFINKYESNLSKFDKHCACRSSESCFFAQKNTCGLARCNGKSLLESSFHKSSLIIFTPPRWLWFLCNISDWRCNTQVPINQNQNLWYHSFQFWFPRSNVLVLVDLCIEWYFVSVTQQNTYISTHLKTFLSKSYFQSFYDVNANSFLV